MQGGLGCVLVPPLHEIKLDEIGTTIRQEREIRDVHLGHKGVIN